MRVSNLLAQKLGVDAILSQQARMTKTQSQLSSGMRVLTPADDPAAATRALDLQETIRVTTQYQNNIAAARNRLTTEDSALDQGTNVLQRARELAVQGANQGALTPKDKLSLEKEVRQLVSEMESIVNTSDSNSDFLFSGYRTDAKPFVTGTSPAYPPVPPALVGPTVFRYQGESSQRLVQIGAARQIADGDPGTVFDNIPSRATVTSNATTTPPTTYTLNYSQNILMVLRNFADALAGQSPTLPNPPPLTTPATDQVLPGDTIQDSLANLDAALQQMLNTRTSVGARLNALDEQESLNDKFILDSKSFLSETQDLDYAEAISRFNLENVALQAAQQAYVKVRGLSLFDFIR